MPDYAKAVALVRAVGRYATTSARALLPLHVLAASFPGSRSIAGLEALAKASDDGAHQFIRQTWRLQYGRCDDSSDLVNALWEGAGRCAALATISTTHGDVRYRLVFGLPVGRYEHDTPWFFSPASADEILAAARAGDSWLVSPKGNKMSLDPDVAGVSKIMDPRTERLIALVESMQDCRALTLYGPPRAGKSVAARQIAESVAGSWVRVAGEAAVHAATWRAIEALRPRAIILDDLDVCAGREAEGLMSGLESARSYARVIVSTLNVLGDAREGGGGETPPPPPENLKAGCVATEPPPRPRFGAAALRGAITTVGRGADEAVVEYRYLAPNVAKHLAPTVPDELRDGRLLAAYLVELEKRASSTARGGITQADVDELLAAQARVGAR